MGLLDPAILQTATGYAYSVSAADSNTFTANAVRTGSDSWSGGYAIDDTGTITAPSRPPARRHRAGTISRAEVCQ